MKIGIPKERQDGELRAAATADTVKRYKALGLEPVVEGGAGARAAIGDAAVAWDCDIVLKVQRPTDEEMGRLKTGQILIGAFDPYNHKDQVQAYASAGAVAFSLELLP